MEHKNCYYYRKMFVMYVLTFLCSDNNRDMNSIFWPISYYTFKILMNIVHLISNIQIQMASMRKEEGKYHIISPILLQCISWQEAQVLLHTISPQIIVRRKDFPGLACFLFRCLIVLCAQLLPFVKDLFESLHLQLHSYWTQAQGSLMFINEEYIEHTPK